MSIKAEYIPLGGGLDLNASSMNIKPGRLIGVRNFEKVYGRQGYSRIDGYERFDGRSKPSEAVFYLLDFSTGTAAINVGDTVNDGTVGLNPFQGVVTSVTISSGSWAGGNAAGTLSMVSTPARMANSVNGHDLFVGGIQKAVATSDPTIGTFGNDLYAQYRYDAAAYYRALIGQPAGTGEILGICVYKGDVYAFRKQDAYRCTMFKSSVSGWTSVKTNIPCYASIKFQFFVGSFTGSAKDSLMFVVNGEGRMFRYDGTTFTNGPDIYGSEGTSTSVITLNNAAPANKTFTIAGTARSWVAGNTLRVNPADTANAIFTATVVSYVTQHWC